MAVAFDAVSSSSTPSGTSVTVSHTCSGADRVLIVDAALGVSNKTMGATYGGVAMTSLGSRHSNDQTLGLL